MVSFSNFGSHGHPSAAKVAEAVAIVRERDPELEIEGEMQADFALDKAKLDALYPFHRLSDDANVLVFPVAVGGQRCLQGAQDDRRRHRGRAGLARHRQAGHGAAARGLGRDHRQHDGLHTVKLAQQTRR